MSNKTRILLAVLVALSTASAAFADADQYHCFISGSASDVSFYGETALVVDVQQEPGENIKLSERSLVARAQIMTSPIPGLATASVDVFKAKKSVISTIQIQGLVSVGQEKIALTVGSHPNYLTLNCQRK